MLFSLFGLYFLQWPASFQLTWINEAHKCASKGIQKGSLGYIAASCGSAPKNADNDLPSTCDIGRLVQHLELLLWNVLFVCSSKISWNLQLGLGRCFGGRGYKCTV